MIKLFVTAVALTALAVAQTATAPNFSTAPNANAVTIETTELLANTSTVGCASATIATTRTSGTVLSVANGASSTAPQVVRFGNQTRATTASITLTISAGTGSGTVWIYGVLLSNGTSTFFAYDSSGSTMAFSSNGTVVELPAPFAPLGPAVLLATWPITAGNFAASGGGTSQVNQPCWVDILTLSNITATAATVTVTDSQTSPLAALQAVSIPANATTTFAWPGGRFFDGGMAIQAGTASAIIANWHMRKLPNSRSNP